MRRNVTFFFWTVFCKDPFTLSVSVIKDFLRGFHTASDLTLEVNWECNGFLSNSLGILRNLSAIKLSDDAKAQCKWTLRVVGLNEALYMDIGFG